MFRIYQGRKLGSSLLWKQISFDMLSDKIIAMAYHEKENSKRKAGQRFKDFTSIIDDLSLSGK
jgi:hypothetical protein